MKVVHTLQSLLFLVYYIIYKIIEFVATFESFWKGR